ncbi:hypothetical protein CFRS1_v009896 [Colletotrichum fructicola]|nr:hypothetical protein CFRS1_v009896 [Colletotrichum fructicola]
MACVQLNHDIPHRNRFHPGNYILHNCWYGVLKSLQGLHVDKSHLGCSNWQHYRHWCINRNGVSNRHHSLAKCELYVELSTERDCLSGQRDNYEYVNVECDFQNRGHRRSHSDRNLFYCQFYETITFLTTLPVGELLSSSEHNHYYLWNRHHGNIDIDGRYFQYQLYHLLVAASIPGHELYFISVYLGQHNGDIERSQRHGNDAAIPCWQCHHIPSIDWQRNCYVDLQCTIRRGRFNIDNHKSRPPHHANPYSLAVCNIDAAVPNFKRHPFAELNILVAAIFVVIVFASLPFHWVFDYSCHCHQLNTADGVFNTMPYVSSMPTCTSKWQNTTFTKSSTGATNRTSSNTATTLITSTTKTSVSAEGDSTTMFEPDGPVVPTTTVSDFTLPSNKAYPWGGNGPLFRRPNTTATDSENVAVRQPGGWWLRWKRHFDRSRSSAKDRGADVTHET